MMLEVNGGKIYADVGGSGPPLLIPGYASTPFFAELVRVFGDDYTVIGHDVRGEALQTDFPPGPYTMDDLADDTAGVLEALGYEKAHYIGHSHTSLLGQAWALRHPEQVERLVLTVCNPGFEPEVEKSEGGVPEFEMSDALNAAERGDPDGVRRICELCFSTAAVKQRPDFVDAVVENVFGRIYALPPEERRWIWGAYGTRNFRDELHKITAPTLIVTTNEEHTNDPDLAWLMWKLIPHATFVALDGTGHMWCLEAPELMAGVIKPFLRGDLDPNYR